jgi:hypothetical protein
LKKKILFILTLVIAAVFLFGASASAYGPGGDGDIDIELSDIEVEGTLYVGQEVTISGTATITVSAEADDWWFYYSQAYAYAEVNYGIVGITGNTVSGEDYDDSWQEGADAEVTLVVPWSITQVFDAEGSYTAGQSAEGYWEWIQGHYVYVGGPPWDPEFEYCEYGDDGSDSDVVSKSFFVYGPHPEMYFRLSALGADGQASYGSGTTTPIPTQNAINAIGQFFMGNGNFYRFVIPEGTVITDVSGQKALCAYIYDIQGTTLYSTFENMTFSNPVTVYVAGGKCVMNEFQQWECEAWNELGSFTEIDENGEINLN